MPQLHWFWRLAIAAAIPLPLFAGIFYLMVSIYVWSSVPLLLGYAWLISVLYPMVTDRFTPKYDSGCCRECGYDLTGNTSGICPECGRPIKPKIITRMPW